MLRLLTFAALALALMATGCSETIKVTQVVISVESDIAYPTTIDEIRATIENPAGETRVASAVLGFAQPDFPRTLVVTHGGGALEGYEVRLDGLFRGNTVVTRDLRFDLVRDQIVQVDVSLDDACRTVSCTGEMTCSAGSCVAPDIATTAYAGATADLHVEMSSVSPDAGVTP